MNKKPMRPIQSARREPSQPRLRFNPLAWSKLLYLRDIGDTEVGGFGVAPGKDLLCIEDIVLVRQRCTPVSVEFEDESVADFFDRMVDAGLRVDQFARLWVHTHPGNCPNPSSVDEDTFARVFGRSDWAVMFILAQGGQTYARLRFNTGPGGSLEIPVEIGFGLPFAGSDHDAWEEEYLLNVTEPEIPQWPANNHQAAAETRKLFDMTEEEQEWFDQWNAYVDYSEELHTGGLIHEQ